MPKMKDKTSMPGSNPLPPVLMFSQSMSSQLSTSVGDDAIFQHEENNKTYFVLFLPIIKDKMVSPGYYRVIQRDCDF